MKTSMLTLTALAALALGGPALGAGLDGNWDCATVNGNPAGSLTIEASSYSFSASGADLYEGGTLVLRQYERPGYFAPKVESGPLKDLFGIRTGFFDPKVAVLVFAIGPERGLTCTPVVVAASLN